ncbi:cytochrome c oxidase subunit II [Paracoccus laeviglucosivorans]|uniref:Cytochrome c oxidase subunit 2 n=1 Tax=Paracoccus laeviglucosivorans TaxID=1197861 RepID=A0A521F9Q8_9RHOB|nr:c-type cytochrome [Paracoccus laeviglucosivorans]SMO92866.1 cytochrome c oxidase subunit 2 [Paracoccus laeviglucosivorans]
MAGEGVQGPRSDKAILPRRAVCLLPLVLIAGCTGRQSALAPAGEDAAQLKLLLLVMLAGAVVLWLALNGLFYYVTRIRPGAFHIRHANRLIIGAGVIFPTVLIGALLAWGLSIMPGQRAPGDGLVIRVKAEEWWWRVEYWPQGSDAPITSANEIRLPTGSRTELRLTANLYIHSLWIPALGGKMDMIPGRETVLTLHPQAAGTYRGQCAEFCGASHALMAFETVVMEPDAFAEWLRAEAAPAAAPGGAGAALFRDEGCGACHTIRGTDFAGTVGPDLTHLASRVSLGAGIMQVSRDDLKRWIAHTGDIKPEVAMPAYDWLSDADLDHLATYLEGLR